jgi:hypothetical protein
MILNGIGFGRLLAMLRVWRHVVVETARARVRARQSQTGSALVTSGMKDLCERSIRD